ncbi:MAG: uncharacterized protein JWQ45_3058 [Blastococcus sp.]|nr:uncharacterized protein [Blastococcus sp.]
MPYTLVSAATLGFDLVRLPAGRSVAEVLLTGLGAGANGLGILASAHPCRGLSRDERGVRAVRSRRAREMAANVPHLRGATGGTDGIDRAAVLVAQLELGTIGDAPTLERLLREDVMGPEHLAQGFLLPEEWTEASDVLADAAIGYWAAGVLPPLVRRELTVAFDRVIGAASFTLPAIGEDLGPVAGELVDVLGAIRAVDDRSRALWRAAVDEGRADHRPWATAMHEASWAAHVSGRSRALAAVQLHAVQAFLDGGFDVHDGAAGVWNAVAGCAQGIAMSDLLDERSLSVLRAPWDRVGTR